MKRINLLLLTAANIFVLTIGLAIAAEVRQRIKPVKTIRVLPCDRGEQYTRTPACNKSFRPSTFPPLLKGNKARNTSNASGKNPPTAPLKLPKKPNVVVIMTDNLSSKELQASVAQGLMPQLNQYVIQQGVNFNQSFVTSPLDSASRTTFLTGQYAHNHKIITNGLPQKQVAQLVPTGTLPEWLKAKGYRTSLIGKYLDGYGQNPSLNPLDPLKLQASVALTIPSGWDHWQALMGNTLQTDTYTLNENGKPIQYGSKPNEYQTDLLTQRALQFIGQSDKRDPAQSFFLWINPVEPRTPNLSPAKPKVAGTTQVSLQPKTRQDSLRAVDNLVGKVVKGLQKTKDWNQTVLIFTSDGGNLAGKNQSLAPGAIDRATHVPLMIRIPGMTKPKTINQLVLNNDLAPTIAELAGAPLKTSDGRSLIPSLTQANPPNGRQQFLVEYPTPATRATVPFSAIRTAQPWVYVEYAKDNRQFYDLTVKPDQQVNLYDKRPKQSLILQKQLEQLKTCQNQQCQSNEDRVLFNSTSPTRKIPASKTTKRIGRASTFGNSIVTENALPGNPPSEWEISGSGDQTIQGFSTQISINKGQPVSFKINTTANNYTIDIYRMGYYGGNGARKIDTIQPSVALPQNQPGCTTETSTGLVDCDNWAVSASWSVPANAISGIYFAKLTRTNNGGSSHIYFVVRDDASTSDILFQTSDTTWQAYNDYGGRSLYTGGPGVLPSRAYKVSYNRPFRTRDAVAGGRDFVFATEYPMVRWLESNGYNVSYFTGVDSDIRGNLIQNHKAFMSNGHDEYWSGQQRANVESARNAGTHLAFFSGNEVYWKTRWENNYRTLVSYKETFNDAKIDPTPTWTGNWRDARFSLPSENVRAENALTGTMFTVNSGTSSITIPAADGKMRFWRNTSVANLTPGSIATLPDGTLGYEWDEDLDNGFRPAGLFGLSSTTLNVPERLLTPLIGGLGVGPGIATHRLTLYKHSSGALVFGAGTIQWAWGLDNNHDLGNSSPADRTDVRMKQATVNLLADMGVQPATLQPGLVATTASTDAVKPTSTITSPAAGSTVQSATQTVITGTATDTGVGVVGGVEVSVDGGNTWHPATGRENWSYTWTPQTLGSANIRTRAVDDSGNIEIPGSGRSVTVAPRTCPCSIWNDSITPSVITDNDTSAVELGVKFTSDVNGFITGVRFYKGAQNTGTHVGTLWSSTGQQLAQATFTNESASGWQQVNFSNPVAVTANTTYVASYHTTVGRYSADSGTFSVAGVDSAPLRALSSSASGGNGVYRYSATPVFPNATFGSTNYWVDPVFVTTVGPDTTAPTVSSNTPANAATGVSASTSVTVTFSEAMTASTINSTNLQLRGPGSVLVPATVSFDAATRTATLTPNSPLSASTAYTASVNGGTTGVKDLAGNALATDYNWSFTTGAPISGTFTIWPATATPAVASANDTSAVELGVKFNSDVNGFITGIRFYKGAQNTGTHVGTLWSSTGQQLAQATFTGESASGWQQVNFSTPVAVTANTTYVASYHTTVGRYSTTSAGLTNAVDNVPLHALSSGASGGNGVYRYSATPAFPNATFGSTNYWVDPVFATTVGPDTTAPTVSSNTPTNAATGVSASTSVTVTFSEAMTASTINSTNVQLRGPSNVLVPATVSFDAATRTATLTPNSALNPSTAYTASVNGGSTGVKDLAGNALATDYTWSFTTGAPISGTFTIWPATATPAVASANDTSAVELGVKFTSDVNGFITGIRFYKGAQNTGTHVGTLWSSTGQQLAQATFTGESASGWQQVNFSTPVAVTANTTYVASYHTTVGRYSTTSAGLANAVDNIPLHALSSGASGGNGIYRYSATPVFPNATFGSTNYWVDPVFATTVGPDTTAPTVSSNTPANAATGVSASTSVTVTFSEAMTASTINSTNLQLRGPGSVLVPATVSFDAATRTATLTPNSPLSASTAYTASVNGGTTGVKDLAGNALATDYNWSFTTGAPISGTFTIWPATATPAVIAVNDPSAVELGVKFTSDVNGSITGIRFYKSTQNTGTHVGTLWDSAGNVLAQATFTGESASGWQQVNFSTPVAVTANTTYVASYHTNVGFYSASGGAFASAGVDNPPLRALSNGASGGNGLYRYSATSAFPNASFNATNYWVDVVFAAN